MAIWKITEHFFFDFYSFLLFVLFSFSFASKILNLKLWQSSKTVPFIKILKKAY